MFNKFQRQLGAFEDARLWCFYATVGFCAFGLISLLCLGGAQTEHGNTFTPTLCVTVGITGAILSFCAYLLISHLADNYQSLFCEELVEEEEELLEADFHFGIEVAATKPQIPHVIDLLNEQIRRLQELAEEKKA